MTTYNIEKDVKDENIDLPDAIIKTLRSCDLTKDAYIICVSYQGDASKAKEFDCTWQNKDYSVHTITLPLQEGKA